MCAQRGRSLWCIVMHVDKAIRRHVLRMLHASAGLCTWHRTDRWTPCRFHFPHRMARGVRRRGWAFHYFFLAFCPFFPGRPDFALRFFCAAFATRVWRSYSCSLSLLFFYARFVSLSLGLSHSLSLSITCCVYRNVLVSLTASFHTSFLSLSCRLTLFSLALFFLAFAFVFCQPPFAALRVRFV